MTTAQSVQFMNKSAVLGRLGISDRTLEKLVRAQKFPPPLRLGKYAMWAEAAVEAWLVQALAPQMAWQPTKRGRRPA